MIKEMPMFTVICNNCGKDCNDDTDYSGYGDEDYAVEVAKESGWTVKDGKHYCSDCYTYNDDDELIINESRPNK